MLYRFGVFEFDGESGELRKNGRAVGLERQPAKALTLLLSRAGEVVSREELRDVIWGATHVDFDRGLAYCVSQIRTALGDSGDNPRFVQTIPKQGFKFIAPVAGHQTPSPTDSRRPVPQAYRVLAAYVALLVIATITWAVVSQFNATAPRPIMVAVSVFDNETGNPAYDRPVAAMSDVVVTQLTRIDPQHISVIGNAAVLRQPRNIRNLAAVAESVKADYVLLGQLQNDEAGLRFITHFIRLKDQAHLKANRLPVADPQLTGLESAVVDEFDRAVREHILNGAGK